MSEPKIKEIPAPTIDELKARAWDLTLYQQRVMATTTKQIQELMQQIAILEQEAPKGK